MTASSHPQEIKLKKIKKVVDKLKVRLYIINMMRNTENRVEDGMKRVMNASEMLEFARANNVKGTLVKRFKRDVLVEYDLGEYGTVKIKAIESQQVL